MDSTDCSCDEPMDIDLSMNSIKTLDNSSSPKDVRNQIMVPSKTLRQRSIKKEEALICDLRPGSDKAASNIEWKVKKYHLKKEPKKRTLSYTKYTIALVAFCFSMFGYYASNISCIDELPLDLIEHALTTKVYGQRIAVNQVIKTLRLKTSSKIFFFYGGTGVGKTFTTSLILKDSWNYSNIYHFTMPSFTDALATNLLTGFIMCKSTVIVVDNLSQNDFTVSTHIKAVIEKSEYLSKDIVIFLIYNCDTVRTGFIKNCDSTFTDRLQDSYKEIKAVKSFVKFEGLTEEILRKCIRDEIGPESMVKVQMFDVLKHFDVLSDGCKGVHTKMKFLNLL